jgi:hypothetical protein
VSRSPPIRRVWPSRSMGWATARRGPLPGCPAPHIPSPRRHRTPPACATCTRTGAMGARLRTRSPRWPPRRRSRPIST